MLKKILEKTEISDYSPVRYKILSKRANSLEPITPMRSPKHSSSNLKKTPRSGECRIEDLQCHRRIVKIFLLPTVVSWDGTDDKGNIVPNGTYFYQLNVGNKSITKSVTLIR